MCAMSSDSPSIKLPPAHDWRTTDEDEINRRRLRAREEAPRIENLTPEHPVFGNFKVHSASGLAYEVEIRDLAHRHFACTCVDFRINGLGTCKHVEAVLLQVEAQEPLAWSAARAVGSDRIDLVPDVATPNLRVETGLARLPARLRNRFDDTGLLRDPASAPALIGELAQATIPGLRLSQEVPGWLDRRRRAGERLRLRRDYEQKVLSGEHPLSETTVPLFPYQREGMLHLAFTERALLADEMGLGKTIQAIAACALLRRLGQARRVLVVTPVSVKGEWDEQIRRFTPLPFQIVDGARAQRLGAYAHAQAPFFTLVNYEQVRTDALEINTRLRPDIVVLDEAQRIKTWNSLTAQAVKRLQSRYAFVLTGTPLENRIDELYSIIDFLSPTTLGPLFRFNREYYTFDERGRPSGYQNLDRLRETVRPLMLRRRKSDVEHELPSREDRRLFVPMGEAQRAVYGQHEAQVSRLLATAQRRPLLAVEQEKLLRELTLLRMACDSAYLVTGRAEDRDSPKLRELDAVLASALAEPTTKVLIFSEWSRMLELVRELLERRRIGFAQHTGAVTPAQRRAELQRFKSEPACRVLVCSEAGGVGLNLQEASIVINCDLPWNPARYEQRVARAWRKHQAKPVTVVNLIAEATIEHRMLDTMAAKQELADGVLDGEGDLSQIPLRGGSQALLARLRQVFDRAGGAAARPADPAVAFGEKCRLLLNERLVACEERFAPAENRSVILVVVEQDAAAWRERIQALQAELFPEANGSVAPRVEVMDRATADLLRRLEGDGLVTRNERAARVLLPAPASLAALDTGRRARIADALTETGRRLRLVRLLLSGEFPAEAAEALRGALTALQRALALRHALPEPIAEDGALPRWLAPFWTDRRSVLERWLAAPHDVATLTPAAEAVEALRAALGDELAEKP